VVQSSFDVETRRAQLQATLERDGVVQLAQAAVAHGVSEMTVRRDLAEMENAGLVRRVRGGAVAVGPKLFERRRSVAGPAKQAIAHKLLPLLPQSGAIAFDASSTMYQFALTIDPGPISVFSTGIETMGVLSRSAKARVLVSGGEVQETTGALVGPLALRSIEQFVFDRSFVSPTCIDAEYGLLESTLEGAEIKQALRRASRSMVVAVDSSKLGGSAMARALEIGEVEVLVTELDPAHTALDEYRDRVDLL
jgi:DeoR family fructose operon transcriptional repressor